MSYSYKNIIGACQYPIVGMNKNSKKWEVVGTCVLIEIGDRHFLVTAAHVMNERHNVLDKTLWLWNHADGVKTTINEDIVCNPYNNVPHESDVAIIEINPSEYPNLSPNQSIDFNHISTELNILDDSTGGFIISGYPSSKNKIVGNINRQPIIHNIITSAHYNNESPTIVELEYNNAMLDKSSSMLPKPQGMSGGGVWKISNTNKELKLIAISVAHLLGSKKVVAVKITLVLSILKFYFPGTLLDKISLPIKIKGDDLFASITVPLQ